jgi:uncharacterized protein involved in outer membrane biogenesis
VGSIPITRSIPRRPAGPRFALRRALPTLPRYLIATVLGLALGASLLWAFAERRTLSEALVASVVAKAGYALHVDGDLTIALLPEPVVTAERVRFGRDAGPEDGTLVQAERAQIGFRAWPLLGGRIEARWARLNGVQVELVVGPDGHGNWAPAVGDSAASRLSVAEGGGSAAVEGRVPDRPGRAVPLRALIADTVEVADASLTWEDRASGRRLSLRGVEGRAVAEGAGVRVDARAADFYGGTLDGTLRFEPGESGRRVALEGAAKAFHAGPLLADLGGPQALSGRADLSGSFATVGVDLPAMIRGLQGKLVLHLVDGGLDGVDLWGGIERARASLQGRVAAEPFPGTTVRIVFDDASARAILTDGVLRSDDLSVKGPWLRATGAGTLNLSGGQLDWRLVPVLVDPPQGRGLKELEGIPIPVLVSGTVGHPVWRLDVASVLAEVARRAAAGRSDSLLERIERRTGIRGLDGVLRGLLGR